MRISWNWLRTLIDTDLTPQRAAEVLTSTGLEVESITPVEAVPGMLQGVVVGQVLACAKHPDADRLSVCQVDVGSGDGLTIVCGAPNVAQGQNVLVATIGTTLHPFGGQPLTIKKSKIRGVESQGMICAADELGLSDDHGGILVLDPAAVIGTPAAEQLALQSDHVLEIGLTPNRADAMGHLGVARDLAAAIAFREAKQVRAAAPVLPSFTQDDNAREVKVDVVATDRCTRYAGLTLTQVKVAPSPAWLQERLRSIGLKPINNVVDVTNFVQHEYGQPLHAFDADRLAGDRIIVRLAREGERAILLDGKERTLSGQDLVIADAERTACVAGVFGGADSGVTEGTTNVFLESARFDPSSVRRTARRLGLNTDASFRFERGVDPENTVAALLRAAFLLKEVAGARFSSPITDVVTQPATWRTITLRKARLDGTIGKAVPLSDAERVLTLLDCRIASRSADALDVQVPPYRVDVEREADLIEEVLRIIGFDQVPLPAHLTCPPVHREEVSLEGFQQRMALHLAARGFREVMDPSLVSAERLARVEATASTALVRLQNPLSAELDVLRPTMFLGLLQSAAHNVARQLRDLRLFEQGRVYHTADGKVVEEERTALLMTGRRWRERWRSDDRPNDITDAREEIELLLVRCGLTDVTVVAAPTALLENAVEWRLKDAVLARAGMATENVLRAFDLAQPVLLAEVAHAVWAAQLARRTTTYREVPRFPAVRRDLSLLLDRSVTFAQLEALARKSERKLLRAVDLFDVYEGDKLPPGKKSYALSFILQDSERTLTDDQVEKAMGRIRSALEQEAGAELRS